MLGDNSIRLIVTSIFGLCLMSLISPWVGAENPPDDPEHPPDVVVERFRDEGNRTIRVTLFDNRVAAVSIQVDGKQTFFRHTTLKEQNYVNYLVALQRDREIIETKSDRGLIGNIGGGCRIRMRATDGTYREFEYSLTAAPDLALARFQATLDDIETVVRESPAGAEDLRHWKPQLGDVVELRRGGRATVTEIREDGTLRLEYNDVDILEMVPAEARFQTIIRVVPK